MSVASWDESIRRVLMHEGGYTHHPADPGGPTNWGITIYDARRYWKRNATAADMRLMPLSVAQRIYRDAYWNALRCDELPAGVDYAMFDYGVNSGIGRAGKVLRRVLGLAADRADVTASVLATANDRDPAGIIDALCAERLAFLKHLATWPVFGKGWGARVADVRAAALALARRAPPAPIAPPQGRAPAGKGIVAAAPGVRRVATATILAGGAAASVPTAKPIVLVAIWAVVALALVALGLMLVRRHRARQEAPIDPPVAPTATQEISR